MVEGGAFLSYWAISQVLSKRSLCGTIGVGRGVVEVLAIGRVTDVEGEGVYFGLSSSRGDLRGGCIGDLSGVAYGGDLSGVTKGGAK